MLLAFALLTLVAFADAIGNATGSPKGCNCLLSSSDTQLYVDCSVRVLVNIDGEQMSHELDSMLSADHFVDHLESLTISHTPLTRVPASVCKLLNLTVLDINHNNITRLPDNCFTKLTKLVKLRMSWTLLDGLQDGLFDGLRSLVTLDFKWNRIAFIGLQVFSNSSNLISLRRLELSENSLTSLEPWWYYLCINGNKTSRVDIHLHDNFISSFTNKMQIRFHCGMKHPYGILQIQRNRISHIMDIFNGWNIGKDSLCVILLCLSGINDAHGGGPFMEFKLGGKTYSCDCTDFPIYKMMTPLPRATTILLDNVRCINSPTSYSYAFQTPIEEFECESSDRCPSSCKCVYRPANATLHVYCSATNLSSLPFELPPLPKWYARYKLDFSNNKLLRRLQHRPYFVNTSILDASNCAIDVVDINVWRELPKMQSPFVTPHVYLQNNKMTSLPSEVTAINFTSVHLTLNNNPWECSCDSHWMIDWFKTLSLTSANAGDISCVQPSRLQDRKIAESTKYDFCVDPLARILKISLCSTLIPVAVLLIFGFTVYRLRVRLFTRWKFHPFDRDECVGENMDFDVFLCCSSEDNNPHGLCILRETESEGYRVCYHLRDFLAGAPIADNMIQAIQRSKRTVCLLSENFLRSSFCMTEFDMAYHHNVAVKRKKRLIVLMMLDSPTDLYANDASNMATLRQYIRQYTYIDYTADDWLDKLLYALPLHGLLQHNQDQRNNDDDDVQLLENAQ